MSRVNHLYKKVKPIKLKQLRNFVRNKKTYIHPPRLIYSRMSCSTLPLQLKHINFIHCNQDMCGKKVTSHVASI